MKLSSLRVERDAGAGHASFWREELAQGIDLSPADMIGRLQDLPDGCRIYCSQGVFTLCWTRENADGLLPERVCREEASGRHSLRRAIHPN